MSNASLQGKVAVVTGGSLGIGAGIVRRLAQEGAAVTLDYHKDSAAAADIASEITGAGGRVLVVQADVSQVGSVQNLIAQTVQTFGQLDILVNNAGIEEPEPFVEVTEASWDRQISVDLKGPYFAAQAAARQMIAHGGGGVIINVSSVHEDLPMVGNAIYCAAKGGLRMLTRTLAAELARYGIRIVNVGPGAISSMSARAPSPRPSMQRPSTIRNARRRCSPRSRSTVSARPRTSPAPSHGWRPIRPATSPAPRSL